MLTIYKASAGSGKTYTLTRDYITTLLGVPERQPDNDASQQGQSIRLNHRDIRGYEERNRHRAILAITFTNKATEEMKGRIVSELDKLRKLNADLYRNRNDRTLTDDQKKSLGYAPYLIDGDNENFPGFGCSPEQLRDTAARALQQLLLDYSHFNVSTIDSFFQLVLRNLAYELDQPGDYEVTLDNQTVVSESVRMMIDDFNCGRTNNDETAELQDLFRNIMTDRRNRGQDVNLFNTKRGLFKEIVGYAANIFDERFRACAETMNPLLNDRTRLHAFEQTADTELKSARADMCDQARLLLDFVLDLGKEVTPNKKGQTVTSTILSFLDKFGANAISDEQKKKTGAPDLAYLCEQVILQNSMAVAAGADDDKILADLAKKILYADCLKQTDTASLGQSIAQHIMRLYHKARYVADLELITDHLHVYRIMGIIGRYIADFRQENNVIILDDTVQMLKSVISDPAGVPFVYEKIGVTLKHFLIDEFQDTSRLQWQCLRPLIDEGLSYRHNSLIIGDEKQAIYRFRNSDSSLLHTDVPAYYRNQARVVSGNDPTHNTNYRSSAAIVRFNNTLFRRLVTQAYPAVADEYSNVEQSIPAALRQAPGYIRFINTKTNSDTTAEGTEDDTKFKTLVAEIKRQHASGYPYRKIAVLTNTNDQATDAAQVLLANDIPVATEEALKLGKSPALNLIVSVMTAVSRMSAPQHISTDRYAETPYFRHRDMDVLELINTMETQYNAMMHANADPASAPTLALQKALTQLSDRNAETSSEIRNLYRENASTLVTLVEFIVDRYLTLQQRNSAAAFIAAFQDEVLNFTTTFSDSLPAFLRWWQTKGQNISLSTPDGTDAVNVMTIHKSKGLEFACVHIPEASWDIGKISTKNAGWIQTPQKLRQAGFPDCIYIKLTKSCGLPGSLFKQEYDNEVRAVMLDDLNKTYVAYTRPKSELTVYFNPETGIGKQLCMVMSAPSTDTDSDIYIPLERYYCNETKEFVYGEPTLYTPDKEEADKQAQNDDKDDADKHEDHRIYSAIDGYNINTRTGRVITTIDSALNLLPGDDDDTDRQIAVDMTAEDKREAKRAIAADRGTRIHAVLNRISCTAVINRVLKNAVKFGSISNSDADLIRNFFNDPKLKPYFSHWFDDMACGRNEVTYTYRTNGPHPDKMHTQRIDRLVFRKDGKIDILDYKTTAPLEQLPEEQQQEQLAQMHEYMRHIARMYPHATVRAYLLYLHARQIRQVK